MPPPRSRTPGAGARTGVAPTSRHAVQRCPRASSGACRSAWGDSAPRPGELAPMSHVRSAVVLPGPVIISRVAPWAMVISRHGSWALLRTIIWPRRIQHPARILVTRPTPTRAPGLRGGPGTLAGPQSHSPARQQILEVAADRRPVALRSEVEPVDGAVVRRPRGRRAGLRVAHRVLNVD